MRRGLALSDPRGPALCNSFSKLWRVSVRRAGLGDVPRLHDLRHAYASALIQAGESVKVLQARMGHASAMVTLDVYGHLWPESDDRTRAAVDAFLARPADFSRTEMASSQVGGGSVDYLEKA
jgi:integrase